jgi:hypothetical protein
MISELKTEDATLFAKRQQSDTADPSGVGQHCIG